MSPAPPDVEAWREPEWERGWEGHEQAQRRRMARLSLRQKLDWLEEAQRLVEHLKQARPTPPPGPSSPRGR